MDIDIYNTDVNMYMKKMTLIFKNSGVLAGS